MKQKLTEEIALAIIYANTRRKPRNRKEDIITIANCFNFLYELYGSRKKVSEKTDLSEEMIRQFLCSLKLPNEIQDMIAKRKIDSVDAVRNLAAISDYKKQKELAKLYYNMQAKDTRDIKRLVKKGNLSAVDAKKKISKAKPKGFNVFMMDFDDEIYKNIIRQASERKIKPAELVKRIVEEWLENQGINL